MIKVCLAGATGWAGSELACGIARTADISLVAAVARRDAGKILGDVLREPRLTAPVYASAAEALAIDCDVFVEYTKPDTAKARSLAEAEGTGSGSSQTHAIRVHINMKPACLLLTLSVLFASASISGCAPREQATRPADTNSTDAEPEVFDGLRVDRYPAFVQQASFPLLEGARYWYSGRFEGKVYQAKITVVKHATPFGDVFYFADDPQISDPSPLVSANMFGLAGYITTGTEILTIHASFFEGFEHERSAYIQTLLRLPLVAGDATQFRDRGTPNHVTVAGHERVTVPAGTFDCIRVQIRDDPDRAEGESFVWLAEGVGMIKWHRKTGRIDELIKYELPSRGEVHE